MVAALSYKLRSKKKEGRMFADHQTPAALLSAFRYIMSSCLLLQLLCNENFIFLPLDPLWPAATCSSCHAMMIHLQTYIQNKPFCSCVTFVPPMLQGWEKQPTQKKVKLIFYGVSYHLILLDCWVYFGWDLINSFSLSVAWYPKKFPCFPFLVFEGIDLFNIV